MNYSKENAKAILKDFRSRGYTEAGAFGLLANIFCESRFNPKNMQDSFEKKLGFNDETYTASVDSGAYSADAFAHDACGYGLCQWTFWSRKSMLYAYCKEIGESIGSLTAQLEYMAREIKLNYKSVYDLLTTTNDREEATRYVMINFENPQDKSATAQKTRVGYCNALYEDLAESKNYVMDVNKFIDKLTLALNSKTLYVSGCFGAPLNDTNKARYGKSNNYNLSHLYDIMNATPDTFGFDCVCLVKGILWGWNADINKVYGGAVYASHGVPDMTENALISYCSDVSHDFSKIGRGELVWMSGHVGVYIGDGKVIECSPKWKNGVQLTYVSNMGYTAGNCRVWTKHGKLPYIDYTNNIVEIKPQSPKTDHSVLLKGSSGAEVGQLIVLLANKGYLCGDFGADVEKAVRQYQKDNNLLVDGRVGPQTWGSLEG